MKSPASHGNVEPTRPAGSKTVGARWATPLYQRALRNPILTSLVLLVVALALRVNDIFVLRLDERLGEIFLSKSLGFALVLSFATLMGVGLRGVGLHRDRLGFAIASGGLGMLLVLAASYGVQLLAYVFRDESWNLVVSAIDPKSGMHGGLLFGAWLLVGNFVNAFMEEGLFRGIFLPLFKSRMRFWRANALQAVLFAGWHLVWPLKAYLTGGASATQASVQAGMLTFATLVSGLVFGYLFQATGSLWAPWLAHTLNNSVLNFLHFRTDAGLDAEILVLNVTLVTGLMVLVPIVNFARRASNPDDPIRVAARP